MSAYQALDAYFETLEDAALNRIARAGFQRWERGANGKAVRRDHFREEVVSAWPPEIREAFEAERERCGDVLVTLMTQEIARSTMSLRRLIAAAHEGVWR